jgi:hypothetical protein
MPVQSYVITKRTGSYSRQELRDGTPVKYVFRNPEFKDKKIDGDPQEYKSYSYRANNIIKLDDDDFKRLGKRLGLVVYTPGKKTLEKESVTIPKNFEKLPLGNIIALAALISGIPIEKLSRSKAIDILKPLSLEETAEGLDA